MNTRAAARTKFGQNVDIMTDKKSNTAISYQHHQDRKKLAKDEKKRLKQKTRDDEARKKRISERRDGGVVTKAVHVNQLMAPRVGDSAFKQTTSATSVGTPSEQAYAAAKSGNITKLDNVISAEASSTEFLSFHGARIGAIAAEHGKIDILLHLFSMKVDIETKDSIGRTFLYLAVQYAHGETAADLASRGADIHARANNGTSCWELAQGISPHLAQMLKQARGDFLKRKRDEKLQESMPYKEGGGDEGKVLKREESVRNEKQSAFDKEYGVKARQSRIMGTTPLKKDGTPGVADFVRWGDAYVPVKEQKEEIPDDFDEDEINLLIRPAQTQEQQQMTAQVSEVIEEMPSAENEEISFYFNLRKSRAFEAKAKNAPAPVKTTAATGLRDAQFGALGAIGAPAPVVGSDVEGDGLVRKSLNDICRVIAQHVLSASKDVLLCTDMHQSLSRFYNTLSVMFSLINEQRGPFLLYDLYRQAHGKGGEMQGVLNTQFQMFDAIRAQTGQDFIQGQFFMDLKFHTQSLVTTIWDFFRQIEEPAPPEEFKLQIREVAQLTRSVNGIWTETGGRIEEDNPVFSLLATEGVFLSHMLFQAFVSSSEMKQKEQLARFNWQMITSLLELTDPVICVSYREPSRTLAQSLSSISSLVPTINFSQVQAPFGDFSFATQQQMYEMVMQTFVEQFDRFKGDIPDSLRESLQEQYLQLVHLQKFVGEQLKPAHLQGQTAGPPLLWTLYQFGEAIQKTSYGMFSFLHSFAISKHAQTLLSMCVQASHLYSSTFRVLSAGIGCGLSMSGQSHGVICLTVCFYVSTLLPSLRAVALSLQALQREQELGREIAVNREEEELLQQIEELAVQDNPQERMESGKRLQEQTSLYGGPMRVSQYGAAPLRSPSPQKIPQGEGY